MSVETSLNPDEITLTSSDDEEELGKDSHDITAPVTTSTPDKHRYPWLDNSPGDEQQHPQHSPGQTGLSSDITADCETTISKSLHSELVEQSSESHDIIDGSCDLDDGSHDRSIEGNRKVLSQVSPSQAVEPCDDQQVGRAYQETMETSSKVIQDKPKIKRRNLSIYQSLEDD